MKREQRMLLKMIDNMELSQENFNLLKDNLIKLLTLMSLIKQLTPEH